MQVWPDGASSSQVNPAAVRSPSALLNASRHCSSVMSTLRLSSVVIRRTAVAERPVSEAASSAAFVALSDNGPALSFPVHRNVESAEAPVLLGEVEAGSRVSPVLHRVSQRCVSHTLKARSCNVSPNSLLSFRSTSVLAARPEGRRASRRQLRPARTSSGDVPHPCSRSRSSRCCGA